MGTTGPNLRSGQYGNGRNLAARIGLHERFSTNGYGWHCWVFDQLALPEGARILEVGCGNGALWLKNKDRLHASLDITLSDFSVGMVRDARRNLARVPHGIRCIVADAQTLPFHDETFDRVIANHMLYHVPRIDAALGEIRRVLASGGRLVAATNGRDHLREIQALLDEFDARLAGEFNSLTHEPFSLETGAAQLAPWFDSIEKRRYEDSLLITEASPLIEYVNSSLTAGPLLGSRLSEFRAFVQRRLACEGAILVRKETGLFAARPSSGRFPPPVGQARLP